MELVVAALIAVVGTLGGVWMGGTFGQRLEDERWQKSEQRDQRQLTSQFVGSASATFRTARLLADLDRSDSLWQRVGSSLLDWELGLDKDTAELSLRIPALAEPAMDLAMLAHQAVADTMHGGGARSLEDEFVRRRNTFLDQARTAIGSCYEQPPR